MSVEQGSPSDEGIEEAHGQLQGASAEDIVRWACDRFGNRVVVSTSFGIHSAAILHLAKRTKSDISVIWVDTGYLPPETYRFADELTKRLDLDVRVYQSPLSPARMEALYGRLWEHNDVASLNQYDEIRKVEPMRRALTELGARAWIAGLRSDQTEHRSTLPAVGRQWGIVKLLPILNWSSKRLHEYMTANDLPYHPLWEQGYATVGDWHSSRPVFETDGHERDTRFRGLKQECGLHLA